MHRARASRSLPPSIASATTTKWNSPWVIGKTCNNVKATEALHYVAGYVIGLDITIRGPKTVSFRKPPDSYTVPDLRLVTADEIPNPATSTWEFTAVNGEVRQEVEIISKAILRP